MSFNILNAKFSVAKFNIQMLDLDKTKMKITSKTSKKFKDRNSTIYGTVRGAKEIFKLMKKAEAVRVWGIVLQFCVFGFLAVLFLFFSRFGWPINHLNWPSEAAHLIHILRAISYPIRFWPSLPHVTK